MLPALLTAIPVGPFKQALAAGPPSPQNPPVVEPAIVKILPPTVNCQITLFWLSATNTAAPAAFTHTPLST